MWNNIFYKVDKGLLYKDIIPEINILDNNKIKYPYLLINIKGGVSFFKLKYKYDY